MQLTTPVQVDPFPLELPLGSTIYALGSCFAERIGERLKNCLFPTVVNPLGTLYNPISLSRGLAPPAGLGRLFLHHGLWRSLHCHGSLAAPTPQEVKARLEKAHQEQNRALSQARLLLLTLGTAQVFETNQGEIVANCHRLDQQLFRRRRLTPQECLDALTPPLKDWLQEECSRAVILTVSPIRYLRDGMVENARGKATLLLTCDELTRLHPRIFYFPAFEMMVDELRDYRFYEQDMVAPTSLAVDLIWERFVHTVLKAEQREALPPLAALSRARQHRFGPDSDPVPLARRSLQRVEELASRHPALDLNEYRSFFRNLLEPITT